MYDTAEITGLIRTIAILVIVYYGFQLLVRYVFPLIRQRLLLYLGKKVQQNMQSRGFNASGFQSPYEETLKDDGNVSIKKKTQKSSRPKNMDDVGEYVDFEEVE